MTNTKPARKCAIEDIEKSPEAIKSTENTCGKCHRPIEKGDTFYRLHASCMDFRVHKHTPVVYAERFDDGIRYADVECRLCRVKLCQNCEEGVSPWELDRTGTCRDCRLYKLGGEFHRHGLDAYGNRIDF